MMNITAIFINQEYNELCSHKHCGSTGAHACMTLAGPTWCAGGLAGWACTCTRLATACAVHNYNHIRCVRVTRFTKFGMLIVVPGLYKTASLKEKTKKLQLQGRSRVHKSEYYSFLQKRNNIRFECVYISTPTVHNVHATSL